MFSACKQCPIGLEQFRSCKELVALAFHFRVKVADSRERLAGLAAAALKEAHRLKVESERAPLAGSYATEQVRTLDPEPVSSPARS